MELIFLDTEGTGNDLKKDRLCQVSYQTAAGSKTAYFKPPVPVSVKASSITHITNKMLENEESFAESTMKQELQTLLNDGVLVAHNAAFDVAMLEAEGMKVPKRICTLRVARHLDEENKIPEYNLQFLRYYLGLEIEGAAHDAETDVGVLKGVFDRLFAKMRDLPAGRQGNLPSDEAVVNEMMEISSRPSLFHHFNFGKYKDKSVSDVAKSDRGYLEWLLAQKIGNPEAEEDWIFTLQSYLTP